MNILNVNFKTRLENKCHFEGNRSNRFTEFRKTLILLKINLSKETFRVQTTITFRQNLIYIFISYSRLLTIL